MLQQNILRHCYHTPVAPKLGVKLAQSSLHTMDTIHVRTVWTERTASSVPYTLLHLPMVNKCGTLRTQSSVRRFSLLSSYTIQSEKYKQRTLSHAIQMSTKIWFYVRWDRQGWSEQSSSQLFWKAPYKSQWWQNYRDASFPTSAWETFCGLLSKGKTLRGLATSDTKWLACQMAIQKLPNVFSDKLPFNVCIWTVKMTGYFDPAFGSPSGHSKTLYRTVCKFPKTQLSILR